MSFQQNLNDVENIENLLEKLFLDAENQINFNIENFNFYYSKINDVN
jgi:hypothetical protein